MGRWVSDKEYWEDSAPFKPHKTMTADEYSAMPIVGWHMVCRDVDGFGGVGIRYLPQPNDERELNDAKK